MPAAFTSAAEADKLAGTLPVRGARPWQCSSTIECRPAVARAQLPAPACTDAAASAPAPPAANGEAHAPHAALDAAAAPAPVDGGAPAPAPLAWLPPTAAAVAFRAAALDAAALLEPGAPPARERLLVRPCAAALVDTLTGT